MSGRDFRACIVKIDKYFKYIRHMSCFSIVFLIMFSSPPSVTNHRRSPTDAVILDSDFGSTQLNYWQVSRLTHQQWLTSTNPPLVINCRSTSSNASGPDQDYESLNLSVQISWMYQANTTREQLIHNFWYRERKKQFLAFAYHSHQARVCIILDSAYANW